MTVATLAHINSAHLQSLLGAMDKHSAVSLSDAQGNILAASQLFCELSGYSESELVGSPYRLLKSDEHDADFFSKMWEKINRGEVWSGEIKNRRKNGDPLWLATTIIPNLDEGNGVQEFVTLYTDVTHYKNIERELADNELRFRFFAENIDEGIVVSEDGKIIDVSDVWVEMFQCPREQAMGKSPLEFTAPHMHEYVKGLIAKGFTEPYESVLARVDGSTFPALVRGRQLEFSGKNVRLTTILDITEQKEKEQALNVAKAEAEHANKVKSDFLSAMSHELRTPLNSVMGFSQLLEMNPNEQLSSSQQECVHHIKKGGKHLLNLINDILELAKIEAGKLEISVEDISLEDLLEESMSLVVTMAGQRGITISPPVYSDKISAVCADYTRTKQVLVNLLSNAIKYNNENGHVTITLGKGSDNFIRISVSDTGPGIPAEKFNQLFKPFNRLGIEASKIEGSGIGLALSKNLVELMKGNIGAESALGKGSTFWFELPSSTLSLLQSTSSTLKFEYPQGTMPSIQGTLLYVEDNPNNLKLMDMIVSHIEGLSMISAHYGRLGIELALSQPVTIIVLDINLPDISGYDVLKVLRENEKTKHIPVIALSAAATKQDIKRGMEAGFAKYLTKPVQVDEFIGSISTLIPEK